MVAVCRGGSNGENEGWWDGQDDQNENENEQNQK